jgi:hypothetical protein
MTPRRRAAFAALLTAVAALAGLLLFVRSDQCDLPDVPKQGGLTDRWPSRCWQPYARDSPFNRRLPVRPRVLPDSAEIVRGLLAQGPVADLVISARPGGDYYHSLHWARKGDPMYTVHCMHPGWGRCVVEGERVRIPTQAQPASGSDGHLAVLDRDTGWEHDFWQVHPRSPEGGVLTVSWGGRLRLTGDGRGGDATGSRLGLVAGVVRSQELLAGRVEHALFLVVGCTSAAVVYPALGQAGTCPPGQRGPATGQYLRLAMTPAEIDQLHLPPWKTALLRAMAQYGGFVGDTGGNEAFGVQLESPRSWTGYGAADPLLPLVRRLVKTRDSGVTRSADGSYRLALGVGVDWVNRLEVLDPCVAERRC